MVVSRFSQPKEGDKYNQSRDMMRQGIRDTIAASMVNGPPCSQPVSWDRFGSQPTAPPSQVPAVSTIKSKLGFDEDQAVPGMPRDSPRVKSAKSLARPSMFDSNLAKAVLTWSKSAGPRDADQGSNRGTSAVMHYDMGQMCSVIVMGSDPIVVPKA